MNPDEQDSAELPKTIKESGKKVLKTAKSIANQRGVGLLNGFTGMLKGANGAFDFFGKFLQGRSKNVKDLAKESLNMASSFSDTATNGAKNVMNSARTIGGKGAKTLYNTLQKTTSFGKNLTKLGGTVLNTPISVGEDLASSVNGFAKVPSKLSRMASGLVKPVVNYFGLKSDEDESEEENDENPSDAEPPITPKTPPPSPPKKLIKKKP
ncbi:ACYPI000472 protein [Aphis craccivora]|uniref:ACYPI000472 protein n=1 Tax=Aphis craccivora TaxID=307492 RepID=A0A6G0ZMS5_APHCR|nr:ACYPI000472 protein [Aphis craccivora]